MKENSNQHNARELLRRSRVEVDPGTFVFVSMPHSAFATLLHDARIGPRGAGPFMIFFDRHEVTLVLEEADFAATRSAISDAKIERGYRLVTFDLVLDPNVTGFIALISEILAEAGVPVMAISAFSRDHVLIRQQDLATALRALSPHVAELC